MTTPPDIHPSAAKRVVTLCGTHSWAVLMLGDCRTILPELPKVDTVVTDPPYPNGAGHFDDGISASKEFCQQFSCAHWIVFWDDVTQPPVPSSLVARHSWHRTNTNRPDNCEAIYEFHSDGARRSSRVFPFCVISPGLTGIRATGHPTEKNEGLMLELVKRTEGNLLDPFMGSGTTGVACARLQRNFIGCEIDPAYYEIACRRIRAELDQGQLF